MYEHLPRNGCCWPVMRFLVDGPSILTTTRLATSRLGAISPADEPSPDVRILRSASLYASRPSSSRGSVVKQTGKHRGRFEIRGVAIVIAVDAFSQTWTSSMLTRLCRISTGDKAIRTLQGKELSRISIYVCQAIWYTAASSTMSHS